MTKTCKHGAYTLKAGNPRCVHCGARGAITAAGVDWSRESTAALARAVLAAAAEVQS
jgi:hypothetical protein